MGKETGLCKLANIKVQKSAKSVYRTRSRAGPKHRPHYAPVPDNAMSYGTPGRPAMHIIIWD